MFSRGQASFDYFLLQTLLFGLLIGGVAVLISSNAFNSEEVDSAVVEDFVDEVKSFSSGAFSRDVGSRVSLDFSLGVDFLRVVHPVNSSGFVVDDVLFFVSELGSFPVYFDFPVFFYYVPGGLDAGGKKLFFEPVLDSSEGESSEKFLLISVGPGSVCPSAPLVCLDSSEVFHFNDCISEGASRSVGPIGNFDRDSSSDGSWFTSLGRVVSGVNNVTSFGSGSCALRDFNGDCSVDNGDKVLYDSFKSGCSS